VEIETVAQSRKVNVSSGRAPAAEFVTEDERIATIKNWPDNIEPSG
jgi:hypothetical protein